MTDQDLVSLARRLEPLVEVRPPASEAQVASTERTLGFRLPDGLRGFLSQSNGASIAVTLDCGELISGASPLIWSLNEILAENGAVSAAGAGRARVLCFANAGADGILFGHPLDPTGVVLDEVVAWHPIEGRLPYVAPSFRAFLDGWLRGSLSI